MFEMEITICDRFPAITPFSIRRERMIDIFKLISKLNAYSNTVEKKKEKAIKPKVIRRPAGDDWF